MRGPLTALLPATHIPTQYAAHWSQHWHRGGNSISAWPPPRGRQPAAPLQYPLRWRRPLLPLALPAAMAALLWPSSSKKGLPVGMLASYEPDTAAPLLLQTPPPPTGGAGPNAERPSRRRRIIFFVCVGLVVAAVLALIVVVGSNYRNGSGSSYSGSSVDVRFLAVSGGTPALTCLHRCTYSM